MKTQEASRCFDIIAEQRKTVLGKNIDWNEFKLSAKKGQCRPV